MPKRAHDAAPSLVPSLLGIAAAALLWVGCFDSDEKVRVAMPMGTTTSGIFDPSTSTGFIDMSTSSGGDQTCSDAIDCALDCAGELQMMAQMNTPELSFECFLTCADGLSSQEVLKLFRLTECAANTCADPELFAPNPPICDFDGAGTSTTGGESSSSSGGSSSGSDTGGSDSGSSTGTPPPPPPPPPPPAEPLVDPCLECIIAFVQDDFAEQCMELRVACD